MLPVSRLPLLRRQTESAGVEAILAQAMEYTGVGVEKSTWLVNLSELFDSFAQLPVSCRLSWRKSIENAPVFGLAVRARQARATNKSTFGADVLYTAPCRRARLKSRAANGVLHRRIMLV